MNSNVLTKPRSSEQKQEKQSWRIPVIRFVDLASAENGPTTIPPPHDGFGNSS
jgi:hypothetical protein